MPKKKVLVTYDDHISAVIAHIMDVRGIGRETVGAETGMGFSLFDSRMRGRNTRDAGWKASEVERVGSVLGTDAGVILQRALDNYGGIEKLMSAAGATPLPTTDELAERRRAKDGEPSASEIDDYEGPKAADSDPELGTDEPETP